MHRHFKQLFICKYFIFVAALLLLLNANQATAQTENASNYVSTNAQKGYFTLAAEGSTAQLIIDKNDYAGVIRAFNDLKTDIGKVYGTEPTIINKPDNTGKQIVIAGTIGKSSIIAELIESKKLNIKPIEGKWEHYSIQTIKDPLPGVEQALVIVGSDKRGTIYGIYDVSEKIGVSPWYYWADVPVKTKDAIYIKPVSIIDGPDVKYRGIFLNDEAPALSGWARETFGGFNHKFYKTVFELILRNKGNYLWPAMWPPTAFFDDDPENARLADEYGIVMSTSHHEPLMRSHEEWGRFGGGEWNYNTNKEQLQEFWKGGIERMGNYESVVTMGMRGDGDEAMGEGTAVDLLQTIIKDQRKIIEDVTKKPAEQTPQVWAIYKEVQDYYDKGMRVDDDILVLFCDDNWGNIRILPKKEDLDRKGGFGIYYHFDFVGGPVSYRWLNVTQIEHVWEQMNLAYQWGVEDLWLVNVGDLKPMELPISFFLDFGWNASNFEANDLPAFYTNWAKEQFGEKHAAEIAEILSLYTKYNARRTPEMLKPDTYSLTNYREADKIVNEYNTLLERSKKIYADLSDEYKAAFYQLVLSPVEFCSNLNEMYVAAGKNKLYGEQGRASTNVYAEKVKALFDKDAELTNHYHKELANGKWNHMMAQTHIGYTSWNNPPANKMPAVSYVQTTPHANMGFVIEDKQGWNNFNTFDNLNQQNYYIEIYNKGDESFEYTLTPKQKWIKLSKSSGTVQYEEKVFVSIDWEIAPKQNTVGTIELSGAGQKRSINVPIKTISIEAKGFIENNGIIAIEAANYSNKLNTNGVEWTTVPNLGRTHSSVTIEPANAERQSPGKDSPYLEYDFTLLKGGDLSIETYVSPTLNYKKNEGLKFAIAIDNEAPQIINIHEGETQPDWEYPAWWNNSVTDHIKKMLSKHKEIQPGQHTLKVYMVDPGIVFQKFVINAGGLKPSYLGPTESKLITE